MLKRIVELCSYTSTTGTDALDWLNKNQLAEFSAVEGRWLNLNVPSFFQPESVNEVHPDKV